MSQPWADGSTVNIYEGIGCPASNDVERVSVAIVSVLNLQCAERPTAVRSLISVFDYNNLMLRQSGP
jgi:hypothetical protein